MKVKNKNIKIFLNVVSGPILFVWIAYTVYKQIAGQPDLPLAMLYIKEALCSPQVWKLCLVILLMVVNWMIEARKWQILMMPLQQLPFGISFKSILAGVSIGVSTPNRIGEYGGRMLYVYEEVRLKSILMSLLGNISQLIITLLLGSIGLFIQKHIVFSACAYYNVSQNWFQVFSWLISATTIASIIFYFRAEKIPVLIGSIPFINKWSSKMNGLTEVNVTILLRVLLLSAVRYFVFVGQYILLLQLVHVEVNITDAFWLISVLYLILAVIPGLTLLELGIRGMVAALLFGSFSENTLGIYAASAGIWLINLIIPAIAGVVLLPTLKVFNNKP